MADIQNINGALALGTSAYQGITGIADDILGRINRVTLKKLSIANILRAYYFEVLANLELLDVVNLYGFRDENPNSAMVKALVTRLDSTMATAILFQDEPDPNTDLFHFLEHKGKIDNKDQLMVKTVKGREVEVRTKVFYENILQAVSFTVVKINFLKQLASFSDTELPMLNKLHLHKRLANIRERLSMIKVKLEDIPALAVVAR